MTYRYHPEAQEEFDNQTGNYELKKYGLGLEFYTEIIQTIDRIVKNPKAWPRIESEIRKCVTNRFPFKIIYSIKKDEQEIYIVAVAHQRQKPGYWKDRWPVE